LILRINELKNEYQKNQNILLYKMDSSFNSEVNKLKSADIKQYEIFLNEIKRAK